ncbi:hypothetical protein ACF0H5_004457 [Mactra antiquata]
MFTMVVVQLNSHKPKSMMIIMLEVMVQVGCVEFVGILLFMAGIEKNPGPTDQFNFRYQYLLIQLGSDLLRKIFDERIGTTLDQYLQANLNHLNKILVLINKNVITEDQKVLIPPACIKPLSTSFDITLLACLLRNICGLKNAGDKVWTTPSINDHSLEADIARLRICRNKVGHSGTVQISQTQLDSDWTELSQILGSLNSKLTNSIPNLSDEIKKVETMVIDENLNKIHKETLSLWAEMDKSFDHSLVEISETLGRMELNQAHISGKVDSAMEKISAFEVKLDKNLQRLSQGPVEEKPKKLFVQAQELQEALVQVYRRVCSMLPISPLIDDEEIDLFEVYSEPSLVQAEHFKVQNKTEKSAISSYEEIFTKNGKKCHNVYVSADAGMGKTSFCHRMCLLWSQAHSGISSDDERIRDDIEFLQQFDFLFYVSLRDSNFTTVIDLIKHQLKNVEESLITHVLKVRTTLILLDGLDEWTPTESTCTLPERPLLDPRCVYLTTCRPYKLESLKLRNRDIDHLVEITGIHGDAAKHYVACIVNYLNEKYDQNKTPYDFQTELRRCSLHSQMCIPVICSQLIFLWFDGKLTHMSKSAVYANTLEMLFKRAMEKHIEAPPMENLNFKFPQCFESMNCVQRHGSLLRKICHVAFDSLLSTENSITMPSLVFTPVQLASSPYFLSPEETDYLCKIGLLSKNKVIGRLFEDQKVKLSFIHKSYIEFLAALYIATDKYNNIDVIVKRWSKLEDFFQFDHFYLLLAGLSFDKMEYLMTKLYSNLSNDFVQCHKMAVDDIDDVLYNEKLILLQNITIKCIKEGRASTGTNIDLRLENFVIGNVTEHELVKEMLQKQHNSVKSIFSMNGLFFDEFALIDGLISLKLEDLPSESLPGFISCMLKCKHTLQTLGVSSYLTMKLPIFELDALTSISLCNVKMSHVNYEDFINTLSSKTCLENIVLKDIDCTDHKKFESDCPCSHGLNLSCHNRLRYLILYQVSVFVSKIRNTEIQRIRIDPAPKELSAHLSDFYQSIQYSQLQYINIGHVRLTNIAKLLTDAIQTLKNLKWLRLSNCTLFDSLLKIHSDAKGVKVVLHNVTFMRDCLYAFIISILRNNVVVEMVNNILLFYHEDKAYEIQYAELADYVSSYVSSIEGITVTYQQGYCLRFETK